MARFVTAVLLEVDETSAMPGEAGFLLRDRTRAPQKAQPVGAEGAMDYQVLGISDEFQECLFTINLTETKLPDGIAVNHALVSASAYDSAEADWPTGFHDLHEGSGDLGFVFRDFASFSWPVVRGGTSMLGFGRIELESDAPVRNVYLLVRETPEDEWRFEVIHHYF